MIDKVFVGLRPEAPTRFRPLPNPMSQPLRRDTQLLRGRQEFSLRPKPNARGCSAAWRTTNCARVLDDVDQADLITAVVADKSPCPLTSLRVVDQNLLPSNAHANARSGETFSAPCSTSHFAKRFGGAQRTGNRSLLAPNPLILTQKRDYCRERSRPKSTRYDRKTG